MPLSVNNPLFSYSPLQNMSDDNPPTHAPSPSRSNESTTASDTSVHGPLYHSLEECMKHPRSISNKWLEEVVDVENSPRVFKNAPYNDGALYWVDKDNELLSMNFQAVLESDGKFSKIGPYFNLVGDREMKQPTIPALGKIKAVFQLAPLSVLSAQDIPPLAVERSILALNTLQSLCHTVEARRNQHLDPSKLPIPTPFYRTDVDSNEFKFVASTRPIFRNLPNPGNFPVHGMSLSELKSSKSTTLPRPSDIRRHANSNIIEDSSQPSNNNLTIRTMPDPEDIYSTTLGAADVSTSTVHIPNIRDGDGIVITPDQYEKKLEHGSIVTLNVHFKLWNLRPNTRNNSSYRHKDGDEKGSRVYQTMLNSMQLLPITDISKITDNSDNSSNVPQKRKSDANLNDPGPSTRKKKESTTNKKKVSTRQSTAATNDDSTSKADVIMDDM